MNADVLKLFLTVVRTGSFTKAGKKMHYTTPTVMKQMNELEELTGVELFQRTNHGVVLTEAGNILCEFASETLRRFDSTVLQMRFDKQVSDKKVLRVGVSEQLPLSNANNDFAMIMKLYPQLKTRIVSLNGIENFKEVFGTEFDCFIAPFIDSWEERDDVALFCFGYTRLYFCVPYTHPLSRYDSVSVRDLDHETIVLKKSGSIRSHDSFREDIGKLGKKIHFNETDDNYTCDTINTCIDENSILLSLERWAVIHPFLKMVRIIEDYPVPYGLVMHI